MRLRSSRRKNSHVAVQHVGTMEYEAVHAVCNAGAGGGQQKCRDRQLGPSWWPTAVLKADNIWHGLVCGGAAVDERMAAQAGPTGGMSRRRA